MELNEKMTESMNDPNAHRSPGAPMNDTRLLSGQSRYSDYPVMSSTSNRTGWEISHLTEDKWSLRISFSLEHEDSGSLDRLQWWINSFKEISFELYIAYGWALSFTAIIILNNANIEEMIFESFFSHRWTLSFTARSIKVAQFYLVFCLALRVFIVQYLRKYESVHIPGITSRLDSTFPLNWTWWLKYIATNCQNLMQNCINSVYHDISSLHANASRPRSWKMFLLLSSIPFKQLSNDTRQI